jgi:broad specificity phosphatase PhoE
MEIIFVRHAEPDYEELDRLKSNQIEKNFAALSRDGVEDAKRLLNNVTFEGADIIVSSPYTRALQTAAILNQKLQLDIFVEFGLREWLADKDGGYLSLEQRDERWERFRTRAYDPTKPQSFETHKELNERSYSAISHYFDRRKIIVVCHFNVIESLIGELDEVLPFCAIKVTESDFIVSN